MHHVRARPIESQPLVRLAQYSRSVSRAGCVWLLVGYFDLQLASRAPYRSVKLSALLSLRLLRAFRSAGSGDIQRVLSSCTLVSTTQSQGPCKIGRHRLRLLILHSERRCLRGLSSPFCLIRTRSSELAAARSKKNSVLLAATFPTAARERLVLPPRALVTRTGIRTVLPA